LSLHDALPISFAGGSLGDDLAHLLDVGDGDLAAAEAGDEADHLRALVRGVHRRAHFGGEDAALVRSAEREVAVDHADRLEPRQALRQLLGGERPEPAHPHEADLFPSARSWRMVTFTGIERVPMPTRTTSASSVMYSSKNGFG